jgi:nucleoid DNA-binding protein
MAKTKGKAKPLTKTEIRTQISESTGLTKKEVASVFDALTEVVGKSLGKRGPKVFSFPGLVKFKVVHKKAKKARKGVNPFTGEEMMFKAKPACNVVKARPLKALKDMV